METTRICSCCGQEKPITDFRITSLGQIKICTSCLVEKQRAGKKAKKENAKHVDEVKHAQQLRLADFTPRELMQELKRRGYSFKCEYTVTKYINSDDIEI